MDPTGLDLCLYLELFRNWLSLEQWHQAQYQKWSRTGLGTSFTIISFLAWPLRLEGRTLVSISSVYGYLSLNYSFEKYVQSTSYVRDIVLIAGDIVVRMTDMVPPFETYVLVKKGGIKHLIMWWILKLWFQKEKNTPYYENIASWNLTCWRVSDQGRASLENWYFELCSERWVQVNQQKGEWREWEKQYLQVRKLRACSRNQKNAIKVGT